MALIDFCLDEFLTDKSSQRYKILHQEGIHGSELIDNLIYLRFLGKYEIQQVLKDIYHIDFNWLRLDPTPAEFKQIATKHKVYIKKSTSLTVYIPFGINFDKVEFSLDIPNYEIEYKYICNLNYRLLELKQTGDIISNAIIDLRPNLLFKRLILDCIDSGGTDIHFESSFNQFKVPVHHIRYRIKRELEDSSFKLDWNTLQSVLQSVISKLSPCSALDIDSNSGITTSIADLFGDGTCDVRISGSRVAAGYYFVMAIQTTTTTMLTVDELGFTDKDVAQIRQLADRQTGLTLITGEMRSGKNTTIFAMLNEIVKKPIRIISYENPIENRMSFPQIDYKGDITVLKELMKISKKSDIDIAMLNEIPDSSVAFSVKDLVNSSIGVITTTHLNRMWNLPIKLHEFFGDDYKTIISQLNAVINQKMFRMWSSNMPMQKRMLNPRESDFNMFCHKYGVTQYFQPMDMNTVSYRIQPVVEIMIIDDDMKSAMENFDDVHKSETMMRLKADADRNRIEFKLADLINRGQCSLLEMKHLF